MSNSLWSISLIKLILLFSLLCLGFSEEKLFFALTHFRHGARAPIFLSESEIDDYGMEWKTPGELTSGGHRMHYLLGVYNRKRYIPKLLSEKYNPHDIYVISSNYNRTIQSALSQLQGLYPSDKNNTLNDKQKKYSIPELPEVDIQNINEEIQDLKDFSLPNNINLIAVHIFQDAEMRYRNFENPKCKLKANKIMKTNIKNDIIKNRLEKFNQEWKPLFQKYFTGVKSKIYDYETLEKLADLFVTDISEGFDFEEFKNKTGLNDSQLDELYKYFVEFLGRTTNNYQYGDPEGNLIKLDMSPLFKELIEFIKKRINKEVDIQRNKKLDYNDYSSPKLVMVSGHDSMVSVMLLFLGLMNGEREKFWKVPVYASNIAFEVYNTKETFSRENYSQYVIKVLFNGKLIEGANFSFKDFIDKVNNIAWNNSQMAEFCGYKENGKENWGKKDEEDESYILIKVISFLSGFFLILFIE